MGEACATRKTQVATWQGAVNDAHHFTCETRLGQHPAKCHQKDIACWIGRTPGARPRYFGNQGSNMPAETPAQKAERLAAEAAAKAEGFFSPAAKAKYNEQGGLITQLTDVVKQLYADQTVTKNTVNDLKSHPAESDNTMTLIILGVVAFLIWKMR